MKIVRLLTLIVTALGYTALSYGTSATLTYLQDLPAGTIFNDLRDVSADGSVVVGNSFSDASFPFGLKSQAFRWTRDTGIVGLGDLAESAACQAWGVSADGSVVVGYAGDFIPGSRPEAFRWTNVEGIIGLGDLRGGSTGSRAWGVSADGSVVIGSSFSTQTGSDDEEAFVWTSEGGMIGLGDLPGGRFNSRATAVSADGSVVVGRSDGPLSYEQAFRWTKDEGMVQLADFPAGGYATAISANGKVIVGGRNPQGISGYHQEAFRWTSEEGITDLGDLPGGNYFSIAFGASADGSIIVGSSMGNHGTFEPFIWDVNHGMRRLYDVLVNDYGLSLDGLALPGAATAISDDGRTIIGTNNNVSWIVTLPIPEPSSLMLGMLSLVGISVRWKMRRMV